MEIITSRNFRSGRRTERKKLPLSILSCVQTKKDLMFDLLFGLSFLFFFLLCALFHLERNYYRLRSVPFWREVRKDSLWDRKSNLEPCPCQHKLLIVIMKERREETKTVFVSEPSVRNAAFRIIYYTAPLSGVNSGNVPRNDTFINNTNSSTITQLDIQARSTPRRSKGNLLLIAVERHK